MKRIKLLIFIVLCFIAIPSVYASSVSTKITGTNTIKVGNQTTLYVVLNASGGIKGVDLNYSTSGSISIVSTQALNGMEVQRNSGGRALLYSQNALSSGSSVFAITVRGNSVGTGTLTISRLEATVGGETAIGNSASIAVTVNPSKTQAEIDAENARAKAQREAEAKAREEAEAKAKEEEEAQRLALNKAKLLVEAAERSLLEDDYKAADKAVYALAESEEKANLVNRLYEVRINMLVKERCANCQEKECVDKECKTSNGLLILNIILLLVVIGEFIYIIVKHRRED